MKNLLLIGAFLIGATISYAQPACGTLTVTNNTGSDLDVTAVAGSGCTSYEDIVNHTVPSMGWKTYSSSYGNFWLLIGIPSDGSYNNDYCSPGTPDCGTGTGSTYTVTWTACCAVTIDP